MFELTTERLKLQPLRPEHARDLFPMMDDWMIVRMLAEVPWPLTLRDVESHAAKQRDPQAESEDFAVLLGPYAIGVCGVKRPGTGLPKRTMPRLGYWIGRRYWSRGYGRESVSALVDYAFDAFPEDRVGAGCFADNLASRRLLERLGFEQTRTYTLHCRARNAYIAVDDMQVTRKAWQAARIAVAAEA
jgi:RimJ/RimL family protein N-acetyltransferase